MNLCRLCIKWRNSYVYIFEANRKQGFILADVINDILQLDATPHDGLPAFICKQCFDKVIYFKNFKSICQESKRTLKNLVSHHNGVLLQPTYLNQIILGPKKTEIEKKHGQTSKSALDKHNSFGDDSSLEESILTHCPLFVSIHEDEESTLVYGEDTEGEEGSNCEKPLSYGENPKLKIKTEKDDNDGQEIFNAPLEAEDNKQDFSNEVIDLSVRSKACNQQGNAVAQDGKEGATAHHHLLRYQCDACGERFDSKESIGRHVTVHAPGEDREIRAADSTFSVRFKCETDQGSQNSVPETSQTQALPLDGSQGISQCDLSRRDRPSCSRIKPFVCEQCGKSFSTKKYVKVHARRTHAESVAAEYNCSVCDKLFAYQRDLVNHMKAHSSIKPFVCDECGRGYKTKYARFYHVLSCHRNPQLECKLCSKMFGMKKDLKRHMLGHHAKEAEQVEQHEKRQHSCDVCGTNFKYTYSLKDHILRCHINFKPHDCKVCFKRFALLKDLTCHMRVHAASNPVTCTECGKMFKSKKILGEHVLRFHGDARPHRCQVCGKQFALSKDLKAHMEIHSDAEPYLCNECGKCYKTKYILKKHVLVAHLRHLLPFPCGICSKRFCDPSSLKAHAAIHSDERPFTCVECGLTYKIKSDLNKHVASAHKNSLE